MSAANVQKFVIEGNQVAYRKIGEGPAILIAFHGFGQSAQVFMSLEISLGKQFTIYAIDLYFHGNSQYTGNQPLTKAGWQQLIDAFLRENNIGRFSLMGFSLGGRFALTTVETFADRVDQLILIAPDGITQSFWYQLATRTHLGRRTFRYFLSHLSALNQLGHMLTRLRLLNRTMMRFAELSLGTSEQRERVYQSWTQFRFIWPDLATISQFVNERSIRVRLFTGAFDRIVPGRYVLPLTERLLHYKLTVLQTGHNRLIDLTAERLIRKK